MAQAYIPRESNEKRIARAERYLAQAESVMKSALKHKDMLKTGHIYTSAKYELAQAKAYLEDLKERIAQKPRLA